MDIAVSVLFLLWVSLHQIDASSTNCETTPSEDLPAKDVCLEEDDKEYFSCDWEERIALNKVIFRMCKNSRTWRCETSFSDTFYDTAACLTSPIHGADRGRYANVINEVLEQCSQKRYCILENTEGSAMKNLTTVSVVGSRVPAGLRVGYMCVNTHRVPRMSVCEDRTETGHYINLHGNFVPRNRGNLSCTCDIETNHNTAIYVHILDLRLRTNSQLRLDNDLKEQRHYHSGSVMFGSAVKFNHSRMVLQYMKYRFNEADNIWINVTAHSSTITVSCRAIGTTKHSSVPKTPKQNTIPRASTSKSKVSESSGISPLTFLIIGFLTASVLIGILIFIVMVCRRMKKTSPSKIHQRMFFLTDDTCDETVHCEVIQTHRANQEGSTTRSQYQDVVDSVPSEYKVPWELTPVPKPRSGSDQDPTYSRVSRSKVRQVSGSSGTSQSPGVRTQMLTDSSEDKN